MSWAGHRCRDARARLGANEKEVPLSRTGAYLPLQLDLRLIIDGPVASDVWLDRFAQMVAHLKAGVRFLLLDTKTAAVAIYRDDVAPSVLYFDDTFTLPDLLPGFIVPVSRLFADVPLPAGVDTCGRRAVRSLVKGECP